MKKELKSAGLSLAVLGALSAPGFAQGIHVTVNGDVVSFVGQQPVEQFGNVLVPLRGVFEKLGANVAYDGASKTILAIKDATSVSLRLGSAQAQVNGTARTLSVPAQAVNGTTLVPLRFVSEALGARVEWRGASQTVVILTDGGGNGVAAAAPATANTVPANGGSGAAEVTSLSHNAARPLRGGDVLTVTLQGTPGGNATFSLPGVAVARSIAMRETSPGTYVGRFTVPNNVTLKGGSVLASLKTGNGSSPVIQSGQPVAIDSVGPTLASLAPEPNTSLTAGKPLIYGTYSDAGTGIDTNGTKIVVDGHDVTAQATVTEAFFSYRPEGNLPTGRHTVAVIARDAAGNETRHEWAFSVAAGETLIKDLTFSPTGQALQPGDVLTIRMTGAPGGKARFAVGGAVRNRPMTEESPGVYVSSYTVKRGDSLAKAPITVTFTSASGQTVTQTANQAIDIAAGAPAKPVIDVPQANAGVGDTVTIKGRAAPNATVRYSLKYQGVLIILPAAGTVADGEVKADDRGVWTIPNLTLSAPLGVSKLTYTLEATTVGAAGEVSDPATVDFHR